MLSNNYNGVDKLKTTIRRITHQTVLAACNLEENRRQTRSMPVGKLIDTEQVKTENNAQIESYCEDIA